MVAARGLCGYGPTSASAPRSSRLCHDRCGSPAPSQTGKPGPTLPFPETGDYVFPEGLATVHIDRPADRGTYSEPNVWLIHPDTDT